MSGGLPGKRDVMSELFVNDPSDPPLFMRSQLLESGLRDPDIGRLVREGTLARIRRGAYTLKETWDVSDDLAKHILLCRAVLLACRAEAVLSHVSAVAVLAVPMWDLDLSHVHVTRSDRRGGRTTAGVRQHRGALSEDADVIRVGDLPVTSYARTALDLCRIADVERSLVVVDSMLNRGLTSEPELHEMWERTLRWSGGLTAHLTLRLADGRRESVGETRTFLALWRARLPLPEPQYEVLDASGVVLARLDFAWEKYGVYLEFDGRAKYTAYLRDGETIEDAVLREKRREDAVREATGWTCIRVTWADLYNPTALINRVARALVAGGWQAA